MAKSKKVKPAGTVSSIYSRITDVTSTTSNGSGDALMRIAKKFRQHEIEAAILVHVIRTQGLQRRYYYGRWDKFSAEILGCSTSTVRRRERVGFLAVALSDMLGVQSADIVIELAPLVQKVIDEDTILQAQNFIKAATHEECVDVFRLRDLVQQHTKITKVPSGRTTEAKPKVEPNLFTLDSEFNTVGVR